MRNPIIFSLFFISMSFVTSCGFDEELIPLKGEWHLHSSSGGIGGGGRVVDGENVMIIDANDLMWKIDGVTIFKGKVCHDEGEYFDSIVLYKKAEQISNEFASSLTNGMGYQIIEDSLTLFDICNDCFSYHFVRI